MVGVRVDGVLGFGKSKSLRVFKKPVIFDTHSPRRLFLGRTAMPLHQKR
jgi:hypothetical protein